MTVLNFPASPTLNQVYTANGVDYTWDGVKWTANNATSLDARYVEIAGDTMTGGLTAPSLTATAAGSFAGGDILLNADGSASFGSSNISLNADGSATFAGNITAPNVTSDIRFKENLTAASSQYDDIKQLSALLKNWDWNADAPVNDEIRATRYLGLVAQEAEQVCPSITYSVARTKQGAEIKPAVYEEQVDPQDEENFIQVEVEPAQYEELDDSYKAIKHDVIIMKLLGTVGELIGKVEALEAEVQALLAG